MKNTGWNSIKTFDRSQMQFVLIYEYGAMRVQLWNPMKQCWEHPTPIGSRLNSYEIGSNSTHWMTLPDPPAKETE